MEPYSFIKSILIGHQVNGRGILFGLSLLRAEQIFRIKIEMEFIHMSEPSAHFSLSYFLDGKKIQKQCIGYLALLFKCYKHK